MSVTFLTDTDLGRMPVGKGAPAANLMVEVGTLYMDSNTGTVYKCVAITDGVCVWDNLSKDSGGNPAEATKCDWNAAEGEPGHILNRPFYSESVSETLLEETTIGDDNYITVPGLDISRNGTYTVIWNGTEYVFNESWYHQGDGEYGQYCLGNPIAIGEEDNGHPFSIIMNTYDSSTRVIAQRGDDPFTVSIDFFAETIHKIPKKYLPFDGASSLEDMLVKEILPETSPVFDENEGYFIITEPVEIDKNCSYIVNWNGVEYETNIITAGDGGGILLNKGANVSTMEGVVFAIEITGNIARCMPMDGSTSVTISIKEVQKIPSIYLPPMAAPTVEFIRNDDGTWVATKICEQLVAEIQQGLTPMAVVKNFGYQKETIHVPFTVYDPVANGVVFSTVTYCLPYSDKNTFGYFALAFQIHADGTVHVYANNLNFIPESI